MNSIIAWFFIGAALTVIGGIALFIYECKRASDEHDEEHDLP